MPSSTMPCVTGQNVGRPLDGTLYLCRALHGLSGKEGLGWSILKHRPNRPYFRRENSLRIRRPSPRMGRDEMGWYCLSLPACPSAFCLVWYGSLEVSGHHCGRSYITGFAVPEGNVSAAAAEGRRKRGTPFLRFSLHVADGRLRTARTRPCPSSLALRGPTLPPFPVHRFKARPVRPAFCGIRREGRGRGQAPDRP